MRFFQVFILIFVFSLKAQAQVINISSDVYFPEYLKKEIIAQSKKVCSASNCTHVVVELLRFLGYEAEIDNNNIRIARNLKITSVSVRGLPEFMKKDENIVKNFLLNQIYSSELIENARLLLLFKLRSAGFKDVKINVKTEETFRGYSVIFNIDKGLPHVITKILVECEVPDLRAIVERIFSKEVGKRFDREQIFEVVKDIEKKFLELGYFNVEISFSWKVLKKKENRKETVLIIKVVPGKRYVIKITGNKHIKTKKILKVLTFKEDKAFDEFEIERSIENIKRLYGNKGFPYVRVWTELKDLDNNTVLVKFIINEGKRVKIRKVALTVKGHLQKDDKEEVLNILNTLRYSYYSVKKIEDKLAELKLYLKDKGYFGIIVKYKLQGRTLLFDLDVEGRRIVKEIVGLPGELQNEFKLPVPYKADFETKLRMKVVEFFTSKGFLDVKVNVEKKETKTGSTIYTTFKVNINKGKRYKIGFVIFSGLKRTKVDVLNSITVLNPGKFYSRNSVIEQYSLLSRTQLFTMIDLREIKVSEDGVVNVVYNLEEAPLLRVKGFVGYSSDAGISLKTSGSSSSPFGRGFYFFLSGEYRQDEGSNILFKVGKSGILGKRNRGYLTLIRKREIFESFDVVRYITRVEVSRRQWGKITQNYGLELAREIMTSEGMGKETFYKKTFYITSDFDWRNSFTNPVKGHRIYNKLAYTGGLLGGDASYFLFELKGLKLKPFFKNKLIAALRIGTGYIKPLKENGVPIQDKFYLGGAESIRGYRYGTISPVDSDGNYIGGDFYSLFSFELRYNFLSSVQLATFYDAGQVFPEIGDFTFNNWYSSVGIGFRYLTPVGPLRVDYGYKLKKIPGQGPGRFHISFGFPF
ncbi:BamA/OMP85 family outer membrane protein [Desulfurobacterium atlanticum]|uniref:Outer membrane protein insertion porin family n=1 Tax=Desulfurobacterium atlanticum TaxID=240169 RepID=A0A238XVH2_9BACT|nr:BamA/TamA family outer membrane protein [Desulfurobacterium atlanticum]SNR62531.1 outer membrane protein insertion porin family [Desulfurobacterium atlanticum]